MNEGIEAYHAGLNAEDQALCARLAAVIDAHLPQADSKIWHAHPVWFIADNPIVGYSRLKSGIRLLFWSGQSFERPGLKPEGTFKAAEWRFGAGGAGQLDDLPLAAWLEEAGRIQWDYRNLIKRKGRLERLS